MRLLLEHGDSALKGIHGFRVVLVGSIIVGFLDLPHFVAALISPSQMEMSSSSSAISLVNCAASAVYFWMSALSISIFSLASEMARFFSTVVSSQNCLYAAN